MYTREWKKGQQQAVKLLWGGVVVVGSCKVLRRSTGHCRRRENGRTRAKWWEIKGEPARNGDAAAVQAAGGR